MAGKNLGIESMDNLFNLSSISKENDNFSIQSFNKDLYIPEVLKNEINSSSISSNSRSASSDHSSSMMDLEQKGNKAVKSPLNQPNKQYKPPNYMSKKCINDFEAFHNQYFNSYNQNNEFRNHIYQNTIIHPICQINNQVIPTNLPHNFYVSNTYQFNNNINQLYFMPQQPSTFCRNKIIPMSEMHSKIYSNTNTSSNRNTGDIHMNKIDSNLNLLNRLKQEKYKQQLSNNKIGMNVNVPLTGYNSIYSSKQKDLFTALNNNKADTFITDNVIKNGYKLYSSHDESSNGCEIEKSNFERLEIKFSNIHINPYKEKKKKMLIPKLSHFLKNLPFEVHQYLCKKKGVKVMEKYLESIDNIKSICCLLRGHFPEIMMNIYGNYFIQSLLEKSNSSIRLMILSEIQQDFTRIALSDHGQYSIQQFIKSADKLKEIDIIEKILIRDFMLYVNSPIGNYILDKFITKIPESYRSCLNKKIIESCEHLIFQIERTNIVNSINY